MSDTETEVVADPIDAMTDEQLCEFIKERDGRSPHPKTGRDKLLKAAHGDGTASTEIEAEPEEQDAEVQNVAEADPEAAVPEPEFPHTSPAAAAAALDAVELRVGELIAYLKGELHNFEGGVDGICQLIADRLKAAL